MRSGELNARVNVVCKNKGPRGLQPKLALYGFFINLFPKLGDDNNGIILILELVIKKGHKSDNHHSFSIYEKA